MMIRRLRVLIFASLILFFFAPLHAQVGCQPVDAPIVEWFDNYGYGIDILPDCWVRVTNFDDNTNKPQISNSACYSSPCALRMYCGSNNTAGHYAVVFSPELDGSVNSLYVRLKLRGYSGSKIEVGVSSDTTNASFVPLDTLTIVTSNVWEEHLVSLTSTPPSGGAYHRFAIRMYRSLQPSNGMVVFIDDINVEPCGIWNLNSLRRSMNDVWLSWDTIATPVVDVEYGESGFTSGSGTVLTDVTSPLNIGSLLSGSTDDFRFSTRCGEGTSIAAGTVTVSTLGGDTLALGYCEGFEDNGSNMPSDWRTSGSGVYVSWSASYSGNRGLRLGNRGDIAVLPPLGASQPASELTMGVTMKSYYTGAMVEVGVMEYPEEASSFVPVDTIWTTTQWERYWFNLSDYSGRGRFVALRNSDQNNYYIYVDNLELGRCLVRGVWRTNITSHSVELQWDTVTQAFHGDSIVIEYGASGFVFGTGTVLTVPVRGGTVLVSGGRQKVVVDGLSSDSVYEFIVYGQCGGLNAYCDIDRLSIHTLAQDIVLPYCIDFEQYDNYSFPPDWTRPRMYGECPRVRNYSNISHSGSMSMQMYSNGTSMTEHSTMVLPLIEVDSVRGLQVSFWAYGNCYYGSKVEVGVMMWPDDEATFMAVDTFDLVNYEWRQFISDLSDYNDTGRYIAFRYFANNYNYYGYIDDIEVRACAVDNVRSYGETSHGVTIEWEGIGASYSGAVLEFGQEGFVPGTGTCVTFGTNTYSVTLDTLQAGMVYDYHLWSLCSGESGHCDLYAHSFTTLDEPFVASVCENFNTYDDYSLPTWWRAPLTYNSSPYVYNGNLRLQSYRNSNNQTSLAVLPLLEESDLSNVSLSFDVYRQNNTLLIVGMMSNPLDTNTFVPIDTVDVATWTTANYFVDLSSYTGSGRYIAFWQKGTYGYEVQIDNMIISRCRITEIQSYSPTTTSVMLRWNQSASTEGVSLSYRRCDMPDDSTILVDNISLPYEITGLSVDATYTYRVGAQCHGSSRSCTLDTYNFSTLEEDLLEGWCDDGRFSKNFYVNPNDSMFYVLPYVSDTISQLMLSFDVRSQSSSGSEQSMLIVGICTLPYDISTFVPVDTIHPAYNWKSVTVDFSNYTGNGHHPAFLYKDNDYRTTLTDHLSISKCKATDLYVDRVTDSRVRLNWNNTSASSDGVWICYENDNDNTSSDKVYYTGNSAIIEGLDAGTTYIFTLWVPCQDTSADCQAATVVTSTLAEPMTIPYCYGFEDGEADALPVGWTRPYGNTYPKIVNSTEYAHTGSKSLEMWNNYNTTSMVVMPMLDTDSVGSISSLYVDGWMWSNNTYQFLEVGVMSNPNDSSTFTPVDTVHSNGRRHFKVSLSTYSGTGNYIAFRSYCIYGASGYIYIDDINLRRCVIEQVNSRRPTQTSIDIEWTATSSTTGVYIEYAEVGGDGGSFSPGTGTMIYATQSPYTIDGLTPATYYAFYITPSCNGENDGCNYETIVNQTLHSSVSIPYCDNFDSYSVGDFPANWLRESTFDSASNPIISNNYNKSEHNSVYFKAYDTLYSLVAMPQIDMGTTCTVVDTLYADFWTLFSSNWNSCRLVAGTMTDLYDPNSFQPVDTIAVTEGYTWESKTVTFTSFNTESEYIVFKFISLNGYYTECYLDNLCLEKCMATEVTVGEITQNSVTITWNGHSVDSLVCEYGPTGFIAGEGTLVVINTSPYVIEGLADGTTYQFVFGSVCGCEQYGEARMPGAGSSGWSYWGGWGWGYGSHGWGWGWWSGRHWWEIPGDSPNVGPVVVPVVTQAANLVVPYCEGFENYDSLPFPNSWRKISGSSSYFPMVGDDNHRSGSYSLDMYTAPGTTCIAALPPCDSGTVQDMVLTLSSYSSNSYALNTDALVVGVMDDPDEVSSFIPVDTLQLGTTSNWEQFAVDFASYSGSGRYIALRFKPRWQAYHWYIDDLYVGRCGLKNVYTIATNNGLVVQWTPMHSPDSVIVEYGPQGFKEEGLSHGYVSCSGSGTSGSVVLDAVNPEGTYDIYVYAQCDDSSILCTFNKFRLNPRITLPYCEDFNGYPYGGHPDNWRVRHSATSTDPYVDTLGNGMKVYKMESGTGNNNTIVTLPALQAGEVLSGKRVNVRMRSSSTWGRLQFGVLTDTNDLSSFVAMGTLANSVANDVEEFSISLTGYEGSVNSLAIRASSTSGSTTIWIDRLVFSEDFFPMGMRDGERGYAVREIWWDSGAYYTLEYGYNGTFQTVLSDSCHAELTNLVAGKDYDVYFISQDGERFCQPYRFSTSQPYSLPYCEDFDSYSYYSLPTGWQRLNDGSYYCNSNDGVRPRVWGTGVNNSYCLDFYSPCMQMMIMPEFEVDSVSHLTLVFDVRQNQVSSDIKLAVGVIYDPTDADSFTAIDTVCVTSTNWERKVVSLSPYSGGARYVALQSIINSYVAIYVDNLNVVSCPIPSISRSGATSVTINASVDANLNDEFFMEYGTRGFSQGNGTIVRIDSLPFYISDLQPNSPYDFYLRCDSSAASCFLLDSLTTSSMLQLPYCADWWNNGNNTLPTGWYRYSTYDSYYPYTNSSGEMAFRSARSYECAAVMPDIDIDSIRRMELYFELYTSSYDTWQTGIIVGVMDNPEDMGSFVPIDTIFNNSGYNFESFHVSMASYQGRGRYITFRQFINPDYSYSGYIYLRNLRLQGCGHVDIYLSDATSVTVNANVDANLNDVFFVEYDTTGFVPGNGTLVAVDHLPFVIEGLESNRTYDFYSMCDTLSLSCMPPTTINTLASRALPYCEDFEENATLPDGWLRYSTYNSSYIRIYSYNYYAHGGNQSLYFDVYANNENYAIMPEFEVDSIGDVNLSFWARMDSYIKLIVGVMDDPYDVSTFVGVDTLAAALGGEYSLHRVSLNDYNGSGRFVALLATSNVNSGWHSAYIDDMTIQHCPFTNIGLVDERTVRVSDVNADLGDNALFFVEYDTAGFVEGSGNIVRIDSLPFYISDLESNTSYDFYQRCDSVGYGCNPPVTVTTSSRVTVPYCESFDYSGQSNEMPAGWRSYNNNSSYRIPYVTSSSRLYMYAYAYEVCYVVLPIPDTMPTGSLSLTFDMQTNSPSYSGIIVGIMDDPDDMSTFTLVDTLRCVSDASEQQHVNFGEYEGSGRFIALRHYSSSSARSIYIDNLMVEVCDIARGMKATLYSNNTVRIGGTLSETEGLNDSGSDNVCFFVEYGISGFSPGSGTVLTVDHLPFDITGLVNYTSYDFYFMCDTALPSCRLVQTVTTSGNPIDLSYCEDFDATSNYSLPSGWRALGTYYATNYVYVSNGNAHTGNCKLQIGSSYYDTYYAVLPEVAVDNLSQLAVSFYMYSTYSGSVTVGVMSDPNDYTTFLPVATFTGGSNWQRFIFALEGVHRDAHYLAFRSNVGTSSGYVYIDDVFIDSCGVHGLMVSQTESDRITLSWSKVGNPDISIEYGTVGFERGTGTVIHPDTSPYTVADLDALTSYMFYFDALCNENADRYCNLNYHDSVTRFTPAGGTGCIDPTNLTADYTTCFYGTYGNAMQHTGIVDYGADDIRSRHTVHYDTTATDPRTGGLLRAVPEGSEASVRLGNWNSGGQGSAEAESVVYSLYVDTNAFDLLILRYAAVLQDPDHAIEDQPRFSLELLDDSLHTLDTICAAANFVANSNLGWNQASNMVLWKDWTTVGVDVSPYGGQTVNIRLTTYDCNEGNHYGYAYFTLDCMLKNMRSELCGNVDSNRFYAPSGFAYRWYNETDTSATLSTEQSIRVPTDNTKYFCNCSFVDNAQCSFTLSAYAGTRYPLADFSYSVQQSNCQFYVSFVNNSTVSLDGSDSLTTGEPCESALWDFGNNLISDSYNATTVYSSPGTYTVSLTAGIASDSCTNRKEIQITLMRDSTQIAIVGDSSFCWGDTLTLAVTGLNDSTQYDNIHWFSPQGNLNSLLDNMGNDTVVAIPVSQFSYNPHSDSNFVVLFSTLNPDGCADTLSHSIFVHPVYDFYDSIIICWNQLPYTYYFADDSVVVSDDTNTTPPSGGGGGGFQWLLRTHTVHGCDSIMNLNLKVGNTYSYYDSLTVCQNQLPYTYRFGDDSVVVSNDTNGGGFQWSLTTPTVHGCDSTMNLDLTVVYTTYNSYYDTIVQNQLPYTYYFASDSVVVSNDDLSVGDTGGFQWSLTTLNSRGCDSIIDYHLTVYLNDTIYDTIILCHSQLPYTYYFAGDSVVVSNDDITTPPSGGGGGGFSMVTQGYRGADSTLMLNVIVYPTYSGYDTVTIVQNQLPYTYYFAGDSVVVSDDSFTTLPSGGSGGGFHNDSVSRMYVNRTLNVNTVHGCDSVMNISIILYLNDTVLAYDTVCASTLPVEWNNVEFSVLDSVRHGSDGSMFIEHQAVLLNAGGADSIVMMYLYLIPTTYSSYYDTIVQNQLPYTYYFASDSVVVSNDDLTTPPSGGGGGGFSGQWSLTTLNSRGCDSIIDYHLTVYLNDTIYDTIILCHSQLPYTYYFADDSIVVSDDTNTTTPLGGDGGGLYTMVTQGYRGADSTLMLNVTVYPVFDLYDTVVICYNMLPYSWCDTSFTISDFILNDSLSLESGHWSQVSDHRSLLSIHGCDSAISLNLTVGRTYCYYDTAALCQSLLPYSWLDTAIAISDSLITNQQSQFSLQKPLQTILDCDSVYNLSLTVYKSYSFADSDAICYNQLPYTYYFAGDSVVVSDDSLTTPPSGGAEGGFFNYALVAQTIHGCDSLHTLDLIVYNNTSSTVYDTVVQNQLPYTYLDSTFSITDFNLDSTTSYVSGNWSLITQNSRGCDSLIDYHLTVYLNDTLYDTLTLCHNQLPYAYYYGGESVVVSDDNLTTPPSGGSGGGLYTMVTQSYHGADSTLMLSVIVYPVFDLHDTAQLCYNRLPYSWSDTIFTTSDFPDLADQNNHLSQISVHRSLLTIHGCDSSRTLLLKVYNNYSTVDRQESCNPYEWIDGVIYSQDTYGPQVTLESQYGCDSIVTLDFHISDPATTPLTDTFCITDTYSWHGQSITSGGVYYDSLFTVEGCDSIIVLSLTQLPLPQVSVDVESDCQLHIYGLTAHTDVQYLRWECSSSWSPDWGPQTSSQVWVKPPVPSTTYTITVDYLESRTCPNSATVSLDPMRVPQAYMKVSPEQLGTDDDHFYALDQSLSADTRVWYIDDIFYGDDVRIECYPPSDADSVVVILIAISDQCTDTATQVVPIYRTTVFAPNAFTPDESTNNEFFLQLDGVVDYELFIYNREGILLFHSSDPLQHWDGTYKGSTCPQGSYVWILRYTSEEKPRQPLTAKGSVLLIR